MKCPVCIQALKSKTDIPIHKRTVQLLQDTVSKSLCALFVHRVRAQYWTWTWWQRRSRLKVVPLVKLASLEESASSFQWVLIWHVRHFTSTSIHLYWSYSDFLSVFQMWWLNIKHQLVLEHSNIKGICKTGYLSIYSVCSVGCFCKIYIYIFL